jgi:hypothetical protein
MSVHEEDLDSKPLAFGKFKGRTPEQISEMPPRDAQYLVWAYENVGNSDVCSDALYRELGGKNSRAPVDKSKRDYRTWKPEEQGTLDFPEPTQNRAIDIDDLGFPEDDVPF